jgi:hypothetical protein
MSTTENLSAGFLTQDKVAQEDRSGGVMSAVENLLADFLARDEAAAELKICERTLDRWRRLGEGPPITKLGRRVLYRRSSLQAWLIAREHHGQDDNGLGGQPSTCKLMSPRGLKCKLPPR